MKGLERLEEWYVSHCNGEWEHHSGIDIGTLDNPGWTLKINLAGTKAEDRSLERVKLERSERDWLQYWVANREFHAACGARNLSELIEIFCDWFERSD
ncbi:MAG TPA: immunity 53 family protein [Candidatus Acidoferrales bacterium]|jgi:hypothetical protein|nr:immunity 53 family protein [Candidatus Acidoferrales bacterium]